MTATEFTTQALEWITAGGTIAGAALYTYFKLRAQFQSQIDDLNAKHAENSARLNAHDEHAGIDTELVIGNKAVVAEQIPLQGTGPVNPAPVGPLPDPQAFLPPLGQSQKPSA